MKRVHLYYRLTILLFYAAVAISFGQICDADLPVISPDVAHNGYLTATDVFVGRGITGPYLLTWKGMVANSEQISNGTSQLVRGFDYRVNPNTGELFFTNPLSSSQIVRVDYLYAPGQAVKNSNNILNSVNFNLFQGSHEALILNAQFQPDARITGMGNDDGGMGLMLGLGMNSTILAGSSLNGKMYLDGRGGNLLSRSGLQFGETSNTNLGQLNFGFSRGGAGFSGSGSSGISAGVQQVNASAVTNPIFGVRASASFLQSSGVPDTGKGDESSTFSGKIEGVLPFGTRISISRIQTFLNPTSGSNTDQVQNHVQLSQSFGSSTKLGMTLDQLSSTVDSSTSSNMTGALSIQAQPTKQITLSGNYSNQMQDNASAKVSGNMTSALSIQAQPTKQIAMSGSYTNQVQNNIITNASTIMVQAAPDPKTKIQVTMLDESGGTDPFHNRSAQINFTPSSSLSLTGKAQNRYNAGADDLSGGLGATVCANKFVQITGGVTLRDSTITADPNANRPASYNVGLQLNMPGNIFKVTGGISVNPEDSTGSFARQRTRNFGLVSRLGILQISGNYSATDNYPGLNSLRSLQFNFDLNFVPSTRLTTSWKEDDTLDQSLTSVNSYSLQLTHHLSGIIDLSLGGTMTMTQQNGAYLPNKDYQANASLGLQF